MERRKEKLGPETLEYLSAERQKLKWEINRLMSEVSKLDSQLEAKRRLDGEERALANEEARVLMLVSKFRAELLGRIGSGGVGI